MDDHAAAWIAAIIGAICANALLFGLAAFITP